jgi:hypothetical protein
MSRARSIGAFVIDFVVGDDPRLFAVVCLGLAGTAGLAAAGAAAWWLLPMVVLGALALSVRRARPTT